MKSKREFKKYVDYVGGTVSEEMMIAYHNIKGIDRKAVENAIGKVLGACGAAKSKANIFFDRGPKSFDNMGEYAKEKKAFFRALFKRLNADFTNEINEALKIFNAAVPAEAKAANVSK